MKAPPLVFALIACACAQVDIRDELLTELKAEARAARDKGKDRQQYHFYQWQEFLQSPPGADGGIPK